MNRAAKISAVTQILRLWDAILVTDDGLGARMCKKCAQSHRFGLGSGWGGGGIPLGGVGGRRTENRDIYLQGARDTIFIWQGARRSQRKRFQFSAGRWRSHSTHRRLCRSHTPRHSRYRLLHALSRLNRRDMSAWKITSQQPLPQRGITAKLSDREQRP